VTGFDSEDRGGGFQEDGVVGEILGSTKICSDADAVLVLVVSLSVGS